MNIRFFLVICLALCIGCTQTDLSREFSYTHKNNSRCVIQITYKPKSLINESGKIGAYYYTLQYKLPAELTADKFQAQSDFELNFYDSKEHLLLKISPSGAYKFGGDSSHTVFERNRTAMGWEYKGRFDERRITIENFRDIHSFAVKQ